MKQKSGRLEMIDSIRGLTIISMIGFHACWILWYFNLFISKELLFGTGFQIWERTICCSFIFISGFSFHFGHNHLKKGLIILGIGVAITVASVVFAYDVRDIFGVLWLLGISQIIMIYIDKIVKRLIDNRAKAIITFIIVTAIFIFLWNINMGYVGFGNFRIDVPKFLYKGLFMTFLGFKDDSFYSVDYFSLIPWFFLYMSGYFFNMIVQKTEFEKKIFARGIPVLSWMGRYSLIIYLSHPVILFAVIYSIKMFVLQ